MHPLLATRPHVRAEVRAWARLQAAPKSPVFFTTPPSLPPRRVRSLPNPAQRRAGPEHLCRKPGKSSPATGRPCLLAPSCQPRDSKPSAYSITESM